MRTREIEAAERMSKHRAERERIRALIHDYCFGEMAGKGCVNCPIYKANACDEVRGNAIILPTAILKLIRCSVTDGQLRLSCT